MLESLHSGTKGIEWPWKLGPEYKTLRKIPNILYCVPGTLVSLQDFERKITYGLKTSRIYCTFREIFNGNICVSKDKKSFPVFPQNFATQFRGHSSPRPSQKYQE